MVAGWRKVLPDESAWRPRRGMTASERAAEQDEAAGGRENRRVVTSSGRRVLASVYLRLPPRSRRVYAYLRWSEGRKTRERYICQVTGADRASNLAEAWAEVSRKGLTDARHGERKAKRESWAVSPTIRTIMRANRSRDTRPEMALRSAVHALGLRYRVNRRPVPGIRRTADLVFAGPKIAVFVDGCFWHGCAEHYRPATLNSEFWSKKIEGNRRRDAETDQLLTEAGWTVIRVWEHENVQQAAARVAEVVLSSRSAKASE